MASAGVSVADVVQQLYFCHQCSRTVTINLSPNTEPLCPTCNDGFLEEYEDPNPNPFIDPYDGLDPFSVFMSTFPLFFSNPSASQNPRNFPRSRIFASNNPQPAPTTQTRSNEQPPAFDPIAFFQDYIGSLRAEGTNIEFEVENQPAEGLPVNFGDYFLGHGLEQLIQQLAENDPNRYGTPPASKSAVEALPDVIVDENLMSSDQAQCAVCQDDFEKDMVVRQMPCKHVYHKDCIMPWLELHNSCPVCRYELPTDDPDYENRAREPAGGSGNNNTSNANPIVRSNVFAAGSGSNTGEDEENEPQGRLIMQRTFRIILGPVRGFRDGNAGGDNNNGSSGSGSASGSWQNMMGLD